MNSWTGIHTKEYIADFADRLIVENRASSFAAARFNIRGMGAINDQMGMESGTELMRAYVGGLRDLIGEEGVVARNEGDTFSAVYPKELTDDVVRYLKGMETVAEDGSIRRYISSHAGYYLITGQCRSSKELGAILDEALRMARTHADNLLYSFCDDGILRKIQESKKIEGMFREAIENEEFLVYYQPKVETKRYRMKGAEALCRWVHDGEMILPFRFIPVYEYNGDICELDFYMLEHVCRDIRKWLDEGKRVVRISVNLSREHMGDQHLVEHILSIINQYDVPHQYIEIELTETSTEVDYLELRDVVNSLHKEGIHTSVDDFGVGYSSMNLLAELPWDMVKIDRSFVPLGTDDEEDRKKTVMMQSIISMAQALRLECIAEGVETAEQVLLLKENGCYFVQGYYFDKPMPVEDFEERLSTLTWILAKEKAGGA